MARRGVSFVGEDERNAENTGLMAGGGREGQAIAMFFSFFFPPRNTGLVAIIVVADGDGAVTYREDALPRTDLSHLAVGRALKARAVQRRASRVAAEMRSR